MKKIRKIIPPPQWPISSIDIVNADPLGSYTGRPDEVLDTPVQDADDL